LSFTVLLLAASFVQGAAIPAPPPSPREFRAVWVASVDNGNWPSKAAVGNVELQKQEMISILDRAASLHFNAVILQIRPAGDALYASQLEPWSQYLTGVQGQPPSPVWDPLETWIAEAHRRGLELHAWYNMYRAHVGKDRDRLATNSIARTHPEVVRDYGNYLWMDPGEPIAQQHTLDVLMDVLKRYDIDGLHTDDYYYPYKVKNADFPDDASYQRYRKSGGTLAREDWRRDNINREVQRIYAETKKRKSWVKVGYSPFGIWQPQNPPGIKGLNAYGELYCDARLWLSKGWCDYLVPQLYWKIGGDQDFQSLLAWWLQQNPLRRYIWPGMSVGRHPVDEVMNQIDLARRKSLSTGQVMWSVNSVLRRQELCDAIKTGPYAESALVPACTWLSDDPPPAPTVSHDRAANGALTISLRPAAGSSRPVVYGVYIRYGDTWHFTVLPASSPTITLNPDPTAGPPSAIVVSTVDRFGNESSRVTWSGK
jgi:uncharacterized lipoprotein YddW (UPF0748 family)